MKIVGRGLLCLALVGSQLGCLSSQVEDAAEQDALSSATSRIVGGQPADVGEYPWMAEIFVPGYPQWCGASILNENWVLTAGHCVQYIPEGTFTVRAGVHQISAPDSEVQTREVRRVIIHPDYSQPNYLDNDLALIELSSPLTFTSRVQPIALAQTDAPVGTPARLSGWGDTVTNGESSDVLLETVLPVHDNETCNSLGRLPLLEDSMLCAGFVNGTSGACHGDSGGPLVVARDDSSGGWEQIGIVSRGTGLGGTCTSYTVFTRVSWFVSWIRGYTG